MKIAKVKLFIENSDGTNQETIMFMPSEIADKIHCSVITWKDDWLMTIRSAEDYHESIKKLKSIEK